MLKMSKINNKNEFIKSDCCNAIVKFVEKRRWKNANATMVVSGAIICNKCKKKCGSDGLVELEPKIK